MIERPISGFQSFPRPAGLPTTPQAPIPYQPPQAYSAAPDLARVQRERKRQPRDAPIYFVTFLQPRGAAVAVVCLTELGRRGISRRPRMSPAGNLLDTAA